MLRKVLIGLAVILCMVFAVPSSGQAGRAYAAKVPSVVKADKKCVYQVFVGYSVGDRVQIIQTGSGEFVNKNTMITCSHVVNFEEDQIQQLSQQFGVSRQQLLNGVVLLVRIDGQFYPAQVIADDSERDLAVLRTDVKVPASKIICIRSCVGKQELDDMETCYALGYPGSKADSNGIVHKITLTKGYALTYAAYGNNFYYLINSAVVSEGESGGAVVDRKGYLVGMIDGIGENGGKKLYFAVSSKSIVPFLKKHGISFTYSTAKKVKVDGITYKITSRSKHTATVTSCSKKTVQAVIPSTVRIAGRSYKVTSISKNAFRGCSALSSVVIGKNVKQLGSRAFSGCRRLKSITVKSKSISKVGKKAFSSVPGSATVKAPGKKLKTYRKLFRKAGLSKKVKFKKA